MMMMTMILQRIKSKPHGVVFGAFHHLASTSLPDLPFPTGPASVPAHLQPYLLMLKLCEEQGLPSLS